MTGDCKGNGLFLFNIEFSDRHQVHRDFAAMCLSICQAFSVFKEGLKFRLYILSKLKVECDFALLERDMCVVMQNII